MTPPTYPDVLRLPNTCANGHRLKTPPIRQFAEARLAVQVRTTGFPSTMAFFSWACGYCHEIHVITARDLGWDR